MERIKQLRQTANLPGGQARIDKRHEVGRLSARERVDLLLDEGSFKEMDPYVTHRCTEFGMEKKKVL
jgi:propionyl-CoA carboxylase beta chain